MTVGRTRPASQRQAELDEWLRKASGEGIIDLASQRGSLRAPTNLLQQLAEAVLDSSVSILPAGGLTELRRSWAAFESETSGHHMDYNAGMAVVADPLVACTAAVLGLVSPGRHVAILEPTPPQVVEVVRRVGGMARTVAMRPTEWEFSPAEFAHRVGAQTDLIIVADPNPYSGQYLSPDAREAILAAVEQHGCLVLIDESARHSVVEGEAPEVSDFLAALGAKCIRVDMPAAAVLAQASSAACLIGEPELIAPIRSAVSAFGLGASAIAQSVLARRFGDGVAIDDAATLNGLVASGRALLLDGLDDIGVLGLGGPGGWYVPVRAKALYDGPHDIGDALLAQAGLGALPLAPFYVEGSTDPYILLSYLRDAGVLENSIQRLEKFCAGQGDVMPTLALPSPHEWNDDAAAETDVGVPDRDVLTIEDVSVPETEDAPTEPEDKTLEPWFEKPVAPVGAPPRNVTSAPDESRKDPGKVESASEYPDDDAIRDEPVILPFGRLRGRKSELVPEELEMLEKESETTTVFKLSVPDIATPNITAPAEEPVVPSEVKQNPSAPETPVVDSDKETESTLSTPSPEEKRRAEVERIRRDDEPFFFDDPVR